ncbi:hypothetical protein, partial [Acinetobacter amyesii]|uniref:hypothetical protein n=1 Tax=Acinetobacter amyesii TaxID=2942470 RepID=UPI003F10A255
GVTHVRVSHRQLIIRNTPCTTQGVFFYARRKEKEVVRKKERIHHSFHVIYKLKTERRILSVSLMESSCLI